MSTTLVSREKEEATESQETHVGEPQELSLRKSRPNVENNKRVILLPFTGSWKKFKERYGNDFIKPLFEIAGLELARIVHLPFSHLASKRVFVVNGSDVFSPALKKALTAINGNDNLEIFIAVTSTEGCCKSTIAASSHFDSDDVELFIVTCDQYVDFDVAKFYDYVYDVQKASGRRIDGAVFCFEENEISQKWDFVKLDKNGMFVEKLAEKKRISEIAACGIYWWRRGSDYVKMAKQMLSDDSKKVFGESYISSVFNEAIDSGMSIVDFPLETIHSLKTPEDIDAFEHFVTSTKKNLLEEEAEIEQ